MEISSSNKNNEELISNLPKKDHLNAASNLYEYQGFWYPFVVLEGIISAQKHFKPHPNDIILCGSPKAGSTWLKALAFAIETRTHFDELTGNPLLRELPHDLVPFLESVDSTKNRDPEIPLLSTHLPYSSLPESIIESGCKIIYTCREPKDTFVSLWQYMLRAYGNDEEAVKIISLENELELFCEGKSVWGPYWDHVLGYLKASADRPEHVLLLKYEELKENTLFYVKKIAEFIGKPFSAKEEMEGMPEKIVKLCSFEYLSNLEVNKVGKHCPFGPFVIENRSYFRKGVTGDWRNHLSAEMKEIIDRVTEQKLQGSSFVFGSAATSGQTAGDTKN